MLCSLQLPSNYTIYHRNDDFPKDLTQDHKGFFQVERTLARFIFSNRYLAQDM